MRAAKRIGSLVCLFLLLVCSSSAQAEEMDITSLSLEQLLSLDKKIHMRILEVRDWLTYYETNGITPLGVEPVTLKAKRDDMAGRIAYTTIFLTKIDGKKLYGVTESNKSTYDVVASFQDDEEFIGLIDGEAVSIIGEVQGSSFLDFGDLYMNNCHILSFGQEAENLLSQLKNEQEQQIATQKAATKENYISSCSVIEYKKIERNPDTYKGQKIRVTGKVIDVSEGIFNTEILVQDADKNIWLILYSRKEGESRILENDKVTVYGECSGVDSSYMALFYGADNDTVPAMKAAYIDIK